MSLYAKMTMPDLQRYLWYLNQIQSVEDIVVFMTQQFLFLWADPFLYKSKKCPIHFVEKTQMKINNLKKKYIDI